MEANRAGPLRFFPDILPPLGRTNIAAPFIILFIYGWTRSFWPLRITPDAAFYTVVMGIRRMVSSGESLPVWHAATGIAIPGMIPPVVVVNFSILERTLIVPAGPTGCTNSTILCLIAGLKVLHRRPGAMMANALGGGRDPLRPVPAGGAALSGPALAKAGGV